MKAFIVWIILGVGLFVAPELRADVESGPKAGDKVAELKVYGVVGIVEGKEVDFAADRKDAPTIYIFVSAEEGGVRSEGVGWAVHESS